MPFITEDPGKKQVPYRVNKTNWKFLLVVLILAAIVGGGILAYQYWWLPKQETKIPKTNSVSKNTPCDNYECLISAASKCQPISATIFFSEVPSPFMTDVFLSGQTKYEIKKSSGANDCILTFSSPVATFSMSEKGKENAIAQGMTEYQITAQLEMMNVVLESIAEAQATCPSNATVISAYLTDVKNGVIGSAEVEGGLLKEETTTYTTSSGQKLVCTITVSRQPANTSVTISDTECTNQKGIATMVNDDGMACPKNQIDIGTIVGNLKMNNKYPQCCASK